MPSQAVAVMEESWKEGRRHAVECDLKSFFDTVNHDRLMNALKEKIRCPRALGLIRHYLMASVVLPDGTREATSQGVPQGGPLSLLLANIVLDPLDKELECPAACRLSQIIFRRRKMQTAWPERGAGNLADISSRDMPMTSSSR